MLAAAERRLLEDALEDARARGALGPGPVGPHIDHALALATAVPASPARFLDLGSGGGVPGLVLALVWPEADAVLLEAQLRRTRLLEAARVRLNLARCAVVRGRAEEVGRDPAHREAYDLVVARAFGPPATTAECATPFLRMGGWLVVSEPPEPDPTRWPPDGLARLGLGPAERRVHGGAAFAILHKDVPTSEDWSRRVGMPAKRPLWG